MVANTLVTENGSKETSEAYYIIKVDPYQLKHDIQVFKVTLKKNRWHKKKSC